MSSQNEPNKSGKKYEGHTSNYENISFTVAAFPLPIVHRTETSRVLDEDPESSVFYQMADTFEEYTSVGTDPERRLVTDDYRHPVTGTRCRVIITQSDYWQGPRSNGSTNSFSDYTITLNPLHEEQTLPESLTVSIEPQFHYTENGRAVYTKKGEVPTLPYGSGTRVVVRAAYLHPYHEVDECLSDLLELFGIDISDRPVNPNSRRLHTAEVYYRFSDGLFDLVNETCKELARLIPMNDKNDGNFAFKRRTGSWGEFGLRPVGPRTQLKLYRSHQGSAAPAPLNHPKIELSFSNKYNNNETRPLNTFAKIQRLMSEILASILRWANGRQSDLISDAFFSGADETQFIWHHPTNGIEQQRDQIENYRHAIREFVYTTPYGDATLAIPVRILYALVILTGFSKDDSDITTQRSTTYNHITARANCSKSSVINYIRRFEDEEICRSVRSRPKLIKFYSSEVRDIVIDELIDAYPSTSPIDDLDDYK